MKETLLEKAKRSRSIRRPETATQEEVELVLAWLDGEVNRSQLSVALGRSPSVSIYKVTQIIRSMYQQGVLVKGK